MKVILISKCATMIQMTACSISTMAIVGTMLKVELCCNKMNTRCLHDGSWWVKPGTFKIHSKHGIGKMEINV